MDIKLSPRLAAVAALICPNYVAADIGTDHASLPIYLINNNICPKVIAGEKVKGPYLAAIKAVQSYNLQDKIAVRLGNGLEILQPGEANLISIAGMGGFLIKDILAARPQIVAQTQRLILQPQRDESLLRGYLQSINWQIIAEDLVLDKGIYYQIIAAEPGKMQLNAQELIFGPQLLAKRHPLLKPYLQIKADDLQVLISQLQNNPTGQERLAELKQQLQLIEETGLI